MTLPEFLKAEPAHTPSWTDLVQDTGIPSGLMGISGLYAVYKGELLIYIGHTKNLCMRLGQVIGAMCGGVAGPNYGLHSGGYRIHCEWAQLPEGAIHFEIYLGDPVYALERAAIRAFDPPMNRK